MWKYAEEDATIKQLLKKLDDLVEEYPALVEQFRDECPGVLEKYNFEEERKDLASLLSETAAILENFSTTESLCMT